jgi:hypothetical protein
LICVARIVERIKTIRESSREGCVVSGIASEPNEPPVKKGRVSPAVNFHLVGDEGILFSQATGRLYRLNTTAAFIWCCYEQGLAPLAIAGMLAERFEVTRRLARRDVARTLSDWKTQGLLGNGSGEAVEPQHGGAEASVRVIDKPRAFVSPGFSSRPTRVERHYRLLDVQFRVRYPCRETERLVHPVIAHLEARPDSERGDILVIFDIAASAGG